MKCVRSLRLLPVALLACLALVRIARAQDTPPPPTGPTPENAQTNHDAREHFMQGMQLYQQRDFRGAIREFEVAADLVPSADLWFNIARAHEQLGESGQAADYYGRYLRDRVDPPDRVAVTTHIAELREAAEREQAERIARNRPTTGTLRIETSVPGSEVRIDGRSVGRSPIAVPLSLAPGEHQLNVLHDSRIPFLARVSIDAGVTTGAYADQRPLTQYRAVSGSRIWTWVVGGLGVAALGAAIVLGVIAASQGTATPEARQSSLDWSIGSDIALAGGLLAAISAVLLYFVEGRSISTERVSGSSAAQ